jgi:hypothetical protein
MPFKRFYASIPGSTFYFADGTFAIFQDSYYETDYLQHQLELETTCRGSNGMIHNEAQHDKLNRIHEEGTVAVAAIAPNLDLTSLDPNDQEARLQAAIKGESVQVTAATPIQPMRRR